MKRCRVLGFLFIQLCGNTIYANPWDWISKKVSESDIMLNLAAESIVQKLAGVPFKDPIKFNKYKIKLVELQRKLKEQLAIIEKKPDAEALKKAQALVNELKAEETKLLADAKEVIDPEDFARLKTSIDNRFKFILNEMTLVEMAQGLIGLWNRYAIPSFKQKVKENNPIAYNTAVAKHDEKMSSHEELFRSRRRPLIMQGLEQFFNRSVEHPITVGFVGTGGGYRAMILTLGYLTAFEELGLLDATTYISSLSGSSWFLAPWILSGGSIKDFKATLLEKIQQNRFDLKAMERVLQSDAKSIMNDIIWPKFLFDQPISSVDLFGSLLSETLLAQFGKDKHKQSLSKQWVKVQSGNKPFPIYTAISMHKSGEESTKKSEAIADKNEATKSTDKKDEDKYSYNWYEFTPDQIRNLDLDLYIPSFAFDSIFNKGVAAEIAPEQSLGYLMGIWGSAYAINFKDIDKIIFAALRKELKGKSVLEKVQYTVAEDIINVMTSSPISKLRALPAQVNNPFKGYEATEIPEWLKNRDFLTFIDAGIHYNIPARPFLRPARKVDVIIIGDSSRELDKPVELYNFFNDATRVYDYHYSRVGDQSNKVLHFYKDLKNKQAPKIIYINFNKDEALMKEAQQDPELQRLVATYNLDTLDLQHCISKGYCGTFNFKYTPDELLQLSAMAEFNVKALKKKIEQFIWEECMHETDEEIDIEFGF